MSTDWSNIEVPDGWGPDIDPDEARAFLDSVAVEQGYTHFRAWKKHMENEMKMLSSLVNKNKNRMLRLLEAVSSMSPSPQWSAEEIGMLGTALRWAVGRSTMDFLDITARDLGW